MKSMIYSLLLVIGFCLFGFAQESVENYSAEQQYLFDVFKNRRSIRGYKSDMIPNEHITKILDIARTAPSAGNQQPWKFLVIKDRAKLDLLNQKITDAYIGYFRENQGLKDKDVPAKRDEILENNLKYLGAPVLIIVLVDKQCQYPDYLKWDGPLAAGYLLIAAKSLGYGTVFVTDSIPFEVLRNVLAIPERYDIVCSTPLGIPLEYPAEKEKKTLDEFIVYESFE